MRARARARVCVCVHAPSPACLFRSPGERATVDHLEGGCRAALPRAPCPGAPSSRAPAPICNLNYCNGATFLNVVEGEVEWSEAEGGRGEGAEIKVVSFFGSRLCFC